MEDILVSMESKWRTSVMASENFNPLVHFDDCPSLLIQTVLGHIWLHNKVPFPWRWHWWPCERWCRTRWCEDTAAPAASRSAAPRTGTVQWSPSSQTEHCWQSCNTQVVASYIHNCYFSVFKVIKKIAKAADLKAFLILLCDASRWMKRRKKNVLNCGNTVWGF